MEGYVEDGVATGNMREGKNARGKSTLGNVSLITEVM